MVASDEQSVPKQNDGFGLWFHSAGASVCFSCILTILGCKLSGPDVTLSMFLFSASLPLHCAFALMAIKREAFAPRSYLWAKRALHVEKFALLFTVFGFSSLLRSYNHDLEWEFSAAAILALALSGNYSHFWKTGRQALEEAKQHDRDLRLAYGEKPLDDPPVSVPTTQ
jgi:hypothetical protein